MSSTPVHAGHLRRWFPLLLLGMYGLAFGAITAAWILADNSLLSHYDSGHHHRSVLLVSRALIQEGLAVGMQTALAKLHPVWPPGIFLLHGILGWLLGDGFHALRLYNLLYIPPLIWGVYLLGRRLGDRSTAILAAVLTISSPGVAFHLRHVCIDNAAMVMVVWGMVFVMRAVERPGPKSLVLLGLVSGLGIMFRIQYLFFVVLPLMVAGTRWVREASTRARRIRLLLWMGAGVVTALLIWSPHWTAHLDVMARSFIDHFQGTGDSAAPGYWSGLCSGLVYYSLAPAKLVGWPVVLAAVVALPFLLRGNPRTLYLLLSVLGGVILYGVTISREPRYILPMAPALALLAALGAARLPARVRDVLVPVLLLITAGPTLLAAGSLRRGHEGPPLGRFLHVDFQRSPELRDPTPSVAAMARAYKEHVRAESRDGLHGCLLIAAHPDDQDTLFAFLAPQLPRVRLSISSIYRDEDDEQRWKQENGAWRQCAVLSNARYEDLPTIWQGRFHQRPVLLQVFRHDQLKGILKTARLRAAAAKAPPPR